MKVSRRLSDTTTSKLIQGHLFSALMNQEDGLIPNIEKDVFPDSVRRSVENELDRIPKVYGEGAQ